jgi:hypothetical protein
MVQENEKQTERKKMLIQVSARKIRRIMKDMHAGWKDVAKTKLDELIPHIFDEAEGELREYLETAPLEQATDLFTHVFLDGHFQKMQETVGELLPLPPQFEEDPPKEAQEETAQQVVSLLRDISEQVFEEWAHFDSQHLPEFVQEGMQSEKESLEKLSPDKRFWALVAKCMNARIHILCRTFFEAFKERAPAPIEEPSFGWKGRVQGIN